MSAEIESWERLDTESAKAYAAFCVYRDMGASRSYARVGQHLGKSKHLIEIWGSKHQWQTRIKGYDAELAQVKKDAAVRGIEEMEDRLTALSIEVSNRAVEELRLIPVGSFSPRDVATLLKVSTDNERGLRGDRIRRMTADDKQKNPTDGLLEAMNEALLSRGIVVPDD